MDTIYNPEYVALVERLKSIREENKLTQTDLGKRLGKDQTFVSKYESRERRLDVLEVRDVCRALGAPFIEVIAELDGPAPSVDALGAEDVEEVQASMSETFSSYPELDSAWGATDWKALIDEFVQSGILNYKEIGALMLGHLNPSQVGTSIASKKTFQQQFPLRKTWQAVRQWHFRQKGRCQDCGTRLELQADHMTPREEAGDEADRLENMTLRCRRCNVIRRPSHKLGGQTFLTTEAALMWILFVKRPSRYQEYEKLCRNYGLTMANIRFQEAWAMAHWLAAEGLYRIASDSDL